MQLYGLQQIELIRDSVTSTKAIVAWGKDTLVVSFRGTANKQNALHDIQVTDTTEWGSVLKSACTELHEMQCMWIV